MNPKTIAAIAALGLLPITGFSQPPPAPPAPPAPGAAAVPPVPPVPAVPPNARGDRDRDHDRGEKLPKVPVTYLGVETSSVPTVVAEQLGLAQGFGLVVDYVVPDGPAAAAGLQSNDILKMLNDQILLEPDQLSKLVRSYPEGTGVTLTVLRKGAETKLNAKLGKREVTQRRGLMPGLEKRWQSGDNFGDLGPEFQQEMEEFGREMGRKGEELSRQIRDQMGDRQGGMIDSAVANARKEARKARDEIRRAAEEARNASRNVRVVTTRDNGALKTTRIDLGRAQITYSDAQGEMKIETINNKKVLTAKDPQGRLVFSGPIETKEELDKLPPDVRQRYDKLEQKDIPAVAPAVTKNNSGDDEDNDNDADDEGDEDEDDAERGDDETVQEVSAKPVQSFPARRLGINYVLI
ncbi:MAG: PDZ domain-containing protein [Chthoniobacterales bacterium]|nr:PDZ domain-containing protein [Chthoniobacterales bacterium]